MALRNQLEVDRTAGSRHRRMKGMAVEGETPIEGVSSRAERFEYNSGVRHRRTGSVDGAWLQGDRLERSGGFLVVTALMTPCVEQRERDDSQACCDRRTNVQMVPIPTRRHKIKDDQQPDLWEYPAPKRR